MKLLTTPHTPFDAVILAAGYYPTHPLPLQLLQRAAYVCCCDGAAEAFIAHGNRPDAIVGDGDSLPKELKAHYAGIFHHVSEQDDNDLTKATRHCMSRGLTHIAYVGATGKREDHTLGNIALMMRYFKEFGIKPTLLTDHGEFTPAQGRTLFECTAGQQVSIFNFGCRKLQSDGLRWDSYAYEQLWQGSLNEAIDNTFTLNGDGYYLVYRVWNP